MSKILETELDEFTGSLDNLPSLNTPNPYTGSVLAFGSRTVGNGRRAKKSGNSLPILHAEPHVSYTARYKRSNTSNVFDVEVSGLAKILVAASTATTFRPIIRAFRIKCIVVRGSVGAVGDSASVGLRFLGTNTNEINFLDDTMKIDNNAKISRKPPKMSLASFWQDVETTDLTTKLFTVQYFGTGELYVDVVLDFIIDVNRYVNYSLSGGVGLNTGGIYRDALAPGLDPVGVASI